MSGEVLRSERYPLLPDCMGDTVHPARDGHPWRKACGKCALRPSTDQHACTGLNRDSAINHDEPTIFYCVHREDAEGHNRVCASWAACRANVALAASEARS